MVTLGVVTVKLTRENSKPTIGECDLIVTLLLDILAFLALGMELLHSLKHE